MKPALDPRASATGTYEGWAALEYVQKTSGNGLPDGYNEIGLALYVDGKLRAERTGEFSAPELDIASEYGSWATGESR